MEVPWFAIAAIALVVYSILDGSDLGAGIVQLFLHPSGRQQHTSAPFWDGNESWLALSMFAFYCSAPALITLRSAAFLVGVLALLLLRGFAAEIRNRMVDVAVALSGAALALFFGGVLGNLVSGHAALTLDAFAILCGISALVVVSLQGTLWLMMQAEGDFRLRCRRCAGSLWWAAAFCCLGATIATLSVQPRILANLEANSWISALAVLAMAGLIGIRVCLGAEFDLGAFASAGCLIAGSLACAILSQFPYLPGVGQPHAFDARSFAWLTVLALSLGYNLVRRRQLHSSYLSGLTGESPRQAR